MKEEIQKEFIDRCVEGFNSAASMREAAKSLGISVTKLRKILITSGEYSTELSESIAELDRKGMSIAEIADIESMSRSNVYSYLPYKNVVYNLPETSMEAKKQKRYRERAARAVQENKGTCEHKANSDEHEAEQSGVNNGSQGGIQKAAVNASTPSIVDDELLAWLNAHPGIVANLKKRSKTVRGSFKPIHVTNVEEGKKLCEKYNVEWREVKEKGLEKKVFKAKIGSKAYDFMKSVETALSRIGADFICDHKDVLINEEAEYIYVCSPYYSGSYEGIKEALYNSTNYILEDSGCYPYVGVRAVVIREEKL